MASVAVPQIKLDNVTLTRGATTVFDGLSLSLAERRVGLIGDNGAGKSSLFRLVCGLDAARGGAVSVCGHDVVKHRATLPALVGLMFQNPDDQIIFPTVSEELAFSLSASGIPRKEARARARDFLAARDLASWADRAVEGLSQGQRQHVCLLALLIAAPRVLLLDEPFASLDLPGQASLAADIDATDQQVVVSTHVLAHVRHFERVVWLERGKVRGDGPGDEVCAAYEADVASRPVRSIAVGTGGSIGEAQ
jgi:biotin transport system ATP-binding protein